MNDHKYESLGILIHLTFKTLKYLLNVLTFQFYTCYPMTYDPLRRLFFINSNLSILPQYFLVTASEREGLKGSLAKFGFGVGFVRFANVPESEGTVCVGTILLFFLFVFQFF